MKIEDFINQMNGSHKEGIIQKHIKREYVPFGEKLATAKKIISVSCYSEMPDSNGEKKKVFWTNSVMKHFLTIRAFIELYTDLTFSENPFNDYDALAEKGYDAMILAAIPINDAEAFSNIIDMVYDDEYENINSIEGRIKNLTNGFEEILQAAVLNMLDRQADGGNKNDGDREN